MGKLVSLVVSSDHEGSHLVYMQEIIFFTCRKLSYVHTGSRLVYIQEIILCMCRKPFCHHMEANVSPHREESSQQNLKSKQS